MVITTPRRKSKPFAYSRKKAKSSRGLSIRFSTTMPRRCTGSRGLKLRASLALSDPRRRRTIALFASVIGLLVQVAFDVDKIAAQEKIRIVPSSPGLAAWPMHLAAKEGYFAREGLNPEIIVMRTNTGIAALVTGSIDFTTAGGSALRAAVNGAPLKMILNITKKPDLRILAQKNIQRAEDLRGKVIGVGGNWGTQFYQVLEALKVYGVDKDVQLVSTGDVANGYLSLQQGSMPAVALTPPYSILAKRQG